MKKILTILFIVIAVSMTGFSAWQIISILQERYISREEYDRARESYVSAITPKVPMAEETKEKNPYPEIEVDIAGLLGKNPDCAGWLYYGDANISYPIVQESGDSINGYLHSTFEGTQNAAGCIFMPYDADPAFRYNNTFLYGHNMKDGSMFGGLKKIYRNPEKAMAPYFYIWSRDYEIIRYRVFAAYVVDKESEMYAIPLTAETCKEYIGKAMRLGKMNNNVPFSQAEECAVEAGNPVVTLSTCFGSAGTRKRLLIQGIEIERRKND